MSAKTKSGHFPAFDDLVSTGEYQWRNREAMLRSQKDIVSNQACWARLFGAAQGCASLLSSAGPLYRDHQFFHRAASIWLSARRYLATSTESLVSAMTISPFR